MPKRSPAVQNVADIQEIFLKSFAIYGTALGSLREGNVIAHDPDTDCGIFDEDFTWEQVTEATRRGFSIVAVFGSRYHGMEIAFLRDGVKTDLMLMYRSKTHPGKVNNSLWENGGRNGRADEIPHEYDESMFQVVDGKLGDKTIRTLGESYVRHVYGENWRTPVKKWDWRTMHLCKKTG